MLDIPVSLRLSSLWNGVKVVHAVVCVCFLEQRQILPPHLASRPDQCNLSQRLMLFPRCQKFQMFCSVWKHREKVVLTSFLPPSSMDLRGPCPFHQQQGQPDINPKLARFYLCQGCQRKRSFGKPLPVVFKPRFSKLHSQLKVVCL